jgi:hypothetical protein
MLAPVSKKPRNIKKYGLQMVCMTEKFDVLFGRDAEKTSESPYYTVIYRVKE